MTDVADELAGSAGPITSNELFILMMDEVRARLLS